MGLPPDVRNNNNNGLNRKSIFTTVSSIAGSVYPTRNSFSEARHGGLLWNDQERPSGAQVAVFSHRGSECKLQI